MRKIRSNILLYSCILGTGLVFFILGSVLYTIFERGLGSLSWQFLTQPSSDFGKSGGVFYQIIGTLILTVSCLTISLPISLGFSLYTHHYLKRKKIQQIIESILYGLNATPTIIIGLIGYLVFCSLFKFGVSWTSGCLILSLVVLPTLILNINDAIKNIPEEFNEQAKSMGLSIEQRITAITLHYCTRGIITGSLIGIGRVVGETAAIMFTATTIYGTAIPTSFFDPVTTLQTHILVLAQEAIHPVARQNAWGTALVLIIMISSVNLLSIFSRKKIQQANIK